jgi:hypothetical protein
MVAVRHDVSIEAYGKCASPDSAGPARNRFLLHCVVIWPMQAPAVIDP